MADHRRSKRSFDLSRSRCVKGRLANLKHTLANLGGPRPTLWRLEALSLEGFGHPPNSCFTVAVGVCKKSARSSKPFGHNTLESRGPDRQTTKASPYGRPKTNPLPRWWEGALTIFVYYIDVINVQKIIINVNKRVYYEKDYKRL